MLKLEVIHNTVAIAFDEKMADTKVNEGQMQNISQQLNWLSTYLYFYIKMTALGGVGHEI